MNPDKSPHSILATFNFRSRFMPFSHFFFRLIPIGQFIPRLVGLNPLFVDLFRPLADLVPKGFQSGFFMVPRYLFHELSFNFITVGKSGLDKSGLFGHSLFPVDSLYYPAITQGLANEIQANLFPPTSTHGDKTIDKQASKRGFRQTKVNG